MRRAGAFLTPLEAVAGPSSATGAASLPSSGRTLRVAGAEVSAVVRDGDDVVVRLFHPGSEPASATVADESVVLRPGQIATVRVGRPPPAG